MMIGARKPFDPNAPEYAGEVNLGAPITPMLAPQAIPDLPGFAPAPKGPKLNWAGILADALAGAMGQPGQFAALQARRAEANDAEELYNKRYALQRADHVKDDQTNFNQQIQLADYKRTHPDDDLTTYLDRAGITDPIERQGYFRRKADATTAPPMMSAQGVDEQGNPVMRFFPRAAPQGAAGPPVGTIKDGFRFKGGDPGVQSSWEPVGGPASQAPGGFR